MKQNRIRIGIVGTGTTGKAHLDVWKSMENVDVVGFYEPHDDTANNITEKYQLPRFLHPEILLESCDVMDIATPPEHRFGWCEKAIKKGKHVFVANPMTSTMTEARQLLMLVKESGIKFQVQATDKFNPAVLMAKNNPAVPSYLEFNLQLPFTETDFQEDITDSHLINSISLILSIVKSDVKTVSANTVQVLSDKNDIINSRLEFHNGCVVNITLNRIATVYEKNIRLFYKDACLDIDLLHKKAEVIKIKEWKDSPVFAFDILTVSGNKTVITDNPFIAADDEIKTELEEFRDAILQNTRTANSETDGWIAMEIYNQIMEKTGNNIFVK